MALKTTSPDANSLVEKAERETGQVTIADIELEDGFTNVDVGRISTGLFDVLAMLVKGEAFAVVRGVLEMNGLEAWRRLKSKHSPTTPATALMAVIRVMSPTKVKLLKDLPTAMETWENQAGALEKGPRREAVQPHEGDSVLAAMPWRRAGHGIPKRGGDDQLRDSPRSSKGAGQQQVGGVGGSSADGPRLPGAG
mgnify:CR=1 FL=1